MAGIIGRYSSARNNFQIRRRFCQAFSIVIGTIRYSRTGIVKVIDADIRHSNGEIWLGFLAITFGKTAAGHLRKRGIAGVFKAELNAKR